MIKVIVPLRGQLHLEWINTISKTKYDIAFIENLPVDVARDFAARNVEELYSHVLFVDSDTIVTNEIIDKLVDADVDIISACVAAKGYDSLTYAAFEYGGGNFTPAALSKTVQNVGVVGAACLLVKTDVFKHIVARYPRLPLFFWASLRPHALMDFLALPDKRMATVSEDFWFCLLARACGYEIYIETTARCKHLMTVKV